MKIFGTSKRRWTAGLLVLILFAIIGWLLRQHERSKIPGSVRLEMPQELGTPWRWQLVQFASPDHVVKWQDGQLRVMTVPVGEYRLALGESSSEGQWVTWPQKVQIQPGHQVTFTIDSSLRLDIPQQLGTPWRWQVVRSDKPEQVVQWHSGDQRTMIVPPGDYQLAVSQFSSEGQWVTWPQKVQIQPGHQVTFTIDSSLRLDIPQQLGTPWRWQVVRSDKPDQVVQWHSGDQRTMIVPPGDYQLAVSQFSSQGHWVRWPPKIEVRDNQQVIVNLDSAIQLSVPENQALWRWSVFDFGKPDQIVQWLNGDQRLMLVPEGEYQVKVQVNSGVSETVLPQKVFVRQARTTEVNVSEPAVSQ